MDVPSVKISNLNEKRLDPRMVCCYIISHPKHFKIYNIYRLNQDGTLINSNIVNFEDLDMVESDILPPLKKGEVDPFDYSFIFRI